MSCSIKSVYNNMFQAKFNPLLTFVFAIAVIS